MDFKLILTISVTLTIVAAAEGLHCRTFLVPVGSNVTFTAELFVLKPMPPFIREMFIECSKAYTNIYHGELLYDDQANTFHIGMIRFPGHDIERRTEVKMEHMIFTTTIHDVVKSDNGTYILNIHYYRRFCFALVVFGIDQQPVKLVEEHSQAYFNGYPRPTEISKILGNATVLWLVDGKNYSQDPRFVFQDDRIWIASVTRALHGKNITYRAIQENGSTIEANYTVEVSYGPDAPLVFKPNKAHYFLTSGEEMIDVSCSCDCNPACTILWDKFGIGNNLSLGIVTAATTGEYICTAEKPDKSNVVKRSLVVHVSDTSAVPAAVATIVCIQAVVLIILGLCCLFIYKRNNPFNFPSSFKELKSVWFGVKTTSSGNETDLAANTEMGHYEELASESRNKALTENYESVQSRGTHLEEHLELYENTSMG